MNKRNIRDFESCVESALKIAKRMGANEFEVALSADAGLSISVRNGDVETLEHHKDKGLTVTVYNNKCKGSASTTDLTDKAIKRTVSTAIEISRFTAQDDFAGLPAEDLLAWDYPDLSLHYPWQITADEAVDIAVQCEASALKTDKRIVNSEGSSISSHESLKVYGNSYGFLASYPSSMHSLSCSVIGKGEGAMQRDHWFTASRDSQYLESASKVGRHAAKKTLARLDGKKLSTSKLPIMFSPDMAAGIFGHFISAISGASLYRKSSFLLDKKGSKIFPDWMRILEQPHIIAGLGSCPFDSEGVNTCSRVIVESGTLQSYVLDVYSARKLRSQSTGNAGGVHNLIVEPGAHDYKAMLKQLNKGLLITELMGQGVNIVTGDYSRGAAGFWVEDGKIQYPVEEITIAGNLADMYKNIVAVGNDVDLRRNIRSGSIIVEEMMVAGN